MSDIPRARQLLAEAALLQKEANRLYAQAAKLLTREPAVRTSKRVYVPITQEMRDKVFRLSKDPNLSLGQIAGLCGLPNSGRVSEILHYKR
jgi:hypothetical protein